jgi:hypothetical protein
MAWAVAAAEKISIGITENTPSSPIKRPRALAPRARPPQYRRFSHGSLEPNNPGYWVSCVGRFSMALSMGPGKFGGGRGLSTEQHQCLMSFVGHCHIKHPA